MKAAPALLHAMRVYCVCCRTEYSFGNVGKSRYTAYEDDAGRRFKPDGQGSPCCKAPAYAVRASMYAVPNQSAAQAGY